MFLESELIDLKESLQRTFECDSCLDGTSASWKVEPDVFIIQIRRTDFDKRLVFKTYHKVVFPPKLISATKNYKLRSVVYHEGENRNGHWKVDVRLGSRWFTCSDSIISETSEKEVLYSRQASANLLFYVNSDK